MVTQASHEQNAIDPKYSHGTDGQFSMDSEKTVEAVDAGDTADAGHTGDVGGSKQVDIPPDGGYGWVCTACVFLINAHTWGVNSVSWLSFLIAETNLTNCSPTECSLHIIFRVTHFPAHLPSNMPLLEDSRFR